MIFGLAAMFGVFTLVISKPWVTPHNQPNELVTPCIEKPWVTPHNQPNELVTPCIP